MNIRKILLEPPQLKVNFQDLTWRVGKNSAWRLVGCAIAADLLAQFLVGNPGIFTIMLSLMTVGLGFLPERLAAALAGLYISQSLGSVLLITALVFAGLPKPAVELLGSAWQLWCFVAMASLLLRYIRTPRIH